VLFAVKMAKTDRLAVAAPRKKPSSGCHWASCLAIAPREEAHANDSIGWPLRDTGKIQYRFSDRQYQR